MQHNTDAPSAIKRQAGVLEHHDFIDYLRPKRAIVLPAALVEIVDPNPFIVELPLAMGRLQ